MTPARPQPPESPKPAPAQPVKRARRWVPVWGVQVVRKTKTFFIGLGFKF